MIRNKIKQLWADGKPVINGWLSTSSPFVAEVMAAQGYDALTIDCQHGFVAYESAASMLQAMRASGVVPMVRVPWLDPGDIMKALDAGAYGIICPMINNRAEAERFVSYMRYPPHGSLGWGFDLVTISNDVRLLAGAAQQSIAQARKLIGEVPASSTEKSSNGY